MIHYTILPFKALQVNEIVNLAILEFPKSSCCFHENVFADHGSVNSFELFTFGRKGKTALLQGKLHGFQKYLSYPHLSETPAIILRGVVEEMAVF